MRCRLSFDAFIRAIVLIQSMLNWRYIHPKKIKAKETMNVSFCLMVKGRILIEKKGNAGTLIPAYLHPLLPKG